MSQPQPLASGARVWITSRYLSFACITFLSIPVAVSNSSCEQDSTHYILTAGNVHRRLISLTGKLSILLQSTLESCWFTCMKCSSFRSMLAISAISFVLSSRVILSVLVFLQHNQGFGDHRDTACMVCWGLSKSEIVLPPRSISNSLLSSSFCSTWGQVICGEVICYADLITTLRPMYTT
jgi:hypothetical protein